MTSSKSVTEIGLDVVEGRWTLDRLGDADEVVALSTLKEVAPVVAVGERAFQAGDGTARLGEAFSQRVAASL